MTGTRPDVARGEASSLGGMVTLEWMDEPDAATTSRVRELLLAARESDGRPDIVEGGSLPGEFQGGRHLLASEDGGLAGYAHLDTAGDAFGRQVAELVVHPERRRRGVGAELAQALADRVAPGPAGGNLRVWSHGDHPGAAALAERLGFRRERELLVMRAVGIDEVGEPRWAEMPLPRELRLRTFVPGQDEQVLVDVNARAFAWHPEQAALTVAELRAEQEQDWFDPAGFFLAEDAGGELVGFHWTKIHPANPYRFGGEPVGEVYVLGVDPDAQGGGLGKALTVAGLRYLVARGLRQVILYVEGDNAAAVAVYRGLGFEIHETDVQYAH